MALKLYIPEPLPSVGIHPLLGFRYGQTGAWRGPFDTGAAQNFFESAVFVERPEEADAMVLPHNFTRIEGAVAEYIKKQADCAEEAGISVYAFSFGDYNDDNQFDARVWVFRLSTYRSTIGPKDIVAPTTVQNFNAADLVLRPKTDTPLVSFCGYAGLKTVRQWAAYHLKNMGWELRALRNPILRARKKGIYWRRAAMQALERSPLVRTNFIIRRSFSGALRTIELPPAEARAQFLDSIAQADFVLTPKGDGNYSNRFLETLALGRIPVLIDTDTVLPLEGTLPYEKVVVRVPMQEVKKVAEYIRRFYDALSAEEWAVRQRLARELFDTQLRQDVFFRNFFGKLTVPHD